MSVAEQVLALVFLTKCKNPFLDPVESVRFNKAYLDVAGEHGVLGAG